jgi:predicted restriction endonuclease
MAQLEKNRLVFSPQRIAFRVAKNKSKEEQKKYYRNASNAYIKNPAVRKYIFERDNYSCQFCGSKENLQIDHIVPVYLATKENIFQINHPDNLRLLCGSCNAKRSPNG